MSRTVHRLSRLAVLLALLAGMSALFPGSREPLHPERLIPGVLLASAVVIAVRYIVGRILKRVERPNVR